MHNLQERCLCHAPLAVAMYNLGSPRFDLHDSINMLKLIEAGTKSTAGLAHEDFLGSFGWVATSAQVTSLGGHPS